MKNFRRLIYFLLLPTFFTSVMFSMLAIDLLYGKSEVLHLILIHGFNPYLTVLCTITSLELCLIISFFFINVHEFLKIDELDEMKNRLEIEKQNYINAAAKLVEKTLKND